MKHGKRITTQLPYTCIYKHKHMNTKEIASSSEHFRNTVFLLLKKKYIWKKKKKKKEKKKTGIVKMFTFKNLKYTILTVNTNMSEAWTQWNETW